MFRTYFLSFDRRGEVRDLPKVCMKCGAPATEIVEVDFLNLQRDATISVRVPLCQKHPFVGLMYMIFILTAVVMVALVGLIAFLLPKSGIGLFFIELLMSLVVGMYFFYMLADLHASKIRDDGVWLWPMSGKFVTAYEQHKKDRRRQKSVQELERAVETTSPGEKPTLKESGEVVGDFGKPTKRKKRKRRRVRFENTPLSKSEVFRSLGYLGGCWMAFFVVSLIAVPPWKGKGGKPVANKRKGRGLPDIGFKSLPDEKTNGKTQGVIPGKKIAQVNGMPLSPLKVDGLIAYWSFDEGEGAVIGDRGANGLHGKLTGGRWMDGRAGKAVWLEGKEEFVELDNGAALNFAAGQPFTVSGWLATAQANAVVISFRNNTSPAPVIGVRISRGQLGADVRAVGSEFGTASMTGGKIADQKWHHFALIRQPDGTAELYLDGQQTARRRGRNSGGAITTDLRAIGSDRYHAKVRRPGPPNYNGALDEIAIFNRVLTAEELRSLAGL